MRIPFILTLLIIAFYSCNQPIANPNDVDFSVVKEKLPKIYVQELDSLIKTLNPEEAGYLKKIYELMPLEDKLDYSPVFHYKTLKTTLQARKEMTWGQKVPEKLFAFFVLPQRINNANLDSSRIFFYKEVKERIEGKSMLDAAMEVNHFCHEHVTYQASDERTSSPMTTYLNGYGRCGEESVFVVAALRAMSIPARQVYTPRWAHTDDNHAWVEFWANGKWYYYGATEPLPLPNMGWFTEPARRAMLVGTRINGNYDGDERIYFQTKSYTLINTTSVYAPTKEVFVKTIDSRGLPISEATINFQIFNYGEFFTLGPKKSNKEGIASFLTGYGDLWVSASDGNHYALSELDVRKTDTLILTLNQKPIRNYRIAFDYNPPIKPIPLDVPQDGVEANKVRLLFEDSLRKNYEASFPDSLKILEFASKNNYSFDEVYPIIRKSRGNWRVMKNFLVAAPKNRKDEAIMLLEVLSDKDLHDVQSQTLMDHLTNTKSFDPNYCKFSKEIWKNYVFNPRVEHEMLLPYRLYLSQQLHKKEINNAEKLFTWMKDSLILDSTNYSHVPISALGIFESKYTDGVSRDLVFVEACRTLGIPARLEAGSLEPQYYSDNKWITKNFYNKKEKKSIGISWLKLKEDSKQMLKYYKHFTIAKWKSGEFYTLEYEWDKPLKDFPDKIKLEPGYYRITIGNRQSDGSVLGEFIFFEAKAGETVSQLLSLRTQRDEVCVLGKIDVNSQLLSSQKKACTLVGQHPIIAIWIDPLQEPSKHIIQDINKLKEDFEKKGNKILLIISHPTQRENLDPTYFSNLPSTAIFMEDKNLELLKTLNKQFFTKLENQLPIISIINTKGEIIFLKMGYTIGIGSEIINKL